MQLGFLLGKFFRLDQAMDYSRLMAELSFRLLMADGAIKCYLWILQLHFDAFSSLYNFQFNSKRFKRKT